MKKVLRILSLTSIFSLVYTVSIQSNSWEQDSCLNLYNVLAVPAEENNDRPNHHEVPSAAAANSVPPITKIGWDSQPIFQLDYEIKSEVVDPWPRPSDQRLSPKEFLEAIGSPRPNPSSNMLSSILPQPLSKSDTDDDHHQYVILDEEHRCMYLSNLKAGSSTISMLAQKLNHTSRVSSCYHDGRVESVEYRRLIQLTLNRVSEKECGGNCPMNCSHNELFTTDIFDELLDKYLVYSFGNGAGIYLFIHCIFYFPK
jgi:hypothetical protein